MYKLFVMNLIDASEISVIVKTKEFKIKADKMNINWNA